MPGDDILSAPPAAADQRSKAFAVVADAVLRLVRS